MRNRPEGGCKLHVCKSCAVICIDLRSFSPEMRTFQAQPRHQQNDAGHACPTASPLEQYLEVRSSQRNLLIIVISSKTHTGKATICCAPHLNLGNYVSRFMSHNSIKRRAPPSPPTHLFSTQHTLFSRTQACTLVVAHVCAMGSPAEAGHSSLRHPY